MSTLGIASSPQDNFGLVVVCRVIHPSPAGAGEGSGTKTFLATIQVSYVSGY
jgi:hypothetical protein